MMNIAAHPRYENYQDTGVEWLGTVPSAWAITRLGTVFTERRTKVSDKDYEPLSVTKNGILQQLDSAAKTNDGDNRKLVKKGDFVINSRSDRKGSSGVSPLDGSVSLINIVLQPKGIHPDFCNYVLKSYAFVEEYYRMGHGIVADLWTTRYDEMRGILMALPSPDEQRAIATFLDDKCAKIDGAVKIKEDQIALLRERRQIIIQDAVTRGLNPSAPMKASGIDWIGQIPAHWGVSKLKFLSRKIVDGTHFTPTYVAEGVPFLRVTDLTNMIDGKINWDETRRIPRKEHVELSKRADAEFGDVLLSKNGTIGLTKVIDWTDEFSFFVSLCLIKLTKELSPHYFAAFFGSPLVDEQLSFGSLRTSVTNLHLEKIKELLIVVPPRDEQEELVAYIREISKPIDAGIALKNAQIAALKEYKTSLINAAVTGKIKVI